MPVVKQPSDRRQKDTKSLSDAIISLVDAGILNSTSTIPVLEEDENNSTGIEFVITVRTDTEKNAPTVDYPV